MAYVAFDSPTVTIGHLTQQWELNVRLENMNSGSLCSGVALSSMLVLEARKPSTRFEEAFVGAVQRPAGVLECLTINFSEPWEVSLHLRQKILHIEVRQTLLAPTISFNSPLQHVVIHEPTASEGAVYLVLLLLGKHKSKLKCLVDFRRLLMPPFIFSPTF